MNSNINEILFKIRTTHEVEHNDNQWTTEFVYTLEEAKQAIQQELLKARIETLEWLLEQEVEFGGLELKQSIIDKVADLQKELFKDLQAKLKENSDG